LQKKTGKLYEISKVSGAENLKEAALQFMGKNQSHFADQLVREESKISKKILIETLEKNPVSKFRKFFRKWKH